MANAELRNRKATTGASGNNKKKSKGAGGDDDKKNGARRSKTSQEAAATPSPEPETLWQTFKSHPLVTVAPYFVIPYVFYKLMFVVMLRRPDIMKGIVDLRPAVSMGQPRQVLILGAIGSGTKQVAEGLTKVMKLEVDHEGMNTQELFARDGTISNFLGIRYAPTSSYARERLSSMLSNTCLASTKASGSAFALRSYKPSNCWPWPLQNQTCHQRDCLQFIGREFGCGLTVDACRTPFASVVMLVRHPMHVLQQLVPKICPGNVSTTKAMHPAVRQMAGVFMPDDTNDSTCVATLGVYLIEYHRALLDSQKQGRVDVIVQYENTTLCELAQLAGFTDPSKVVYAPNVDKVTRLCDSENSKADVHSALPLLETKSTDQTMPKTLLQWDDLETVGGASLVNAVKDLCRELGYDPMAVLYTGTSSGSIDATDVPTKEKAAPDVNNLPPGETY